ncbi:cell division protein FtsW [Lachnospiraceae bacterium AM48-27BH]|nr:cell division protein FtsW [Lachnospiraceae bacterium AM48-27BH]
MKKKRSQRFYDYSLLFTIAFLIMFGLLMIYSASSYKAQLDYNGNAAYFMTRQGVIALGGFAFMILISRMDYRWYAKFYKLAIAVSWFMMIAVSFVGRRVNGKRRWLGVGPLSFQPTELVKITIIVSVAALLVKLGRDVDRPAGIARIAMVVLPLAAIVAANNLSSGIIIAGIGFVMLFVASRKKLWYFLVMAAGGLVIAFAPQIGNGLRAIHLLKPYQLSRINVWKNPEAFASEGGYQVLQGLYAIGSGGLFGKGLGESIQKLGFVPEAQNDMIFSIICEELGLFGAVALILVFMFMIYRFMVIASNAPDLFGCLLVVGVMAHIAIQVILNIAVVTNTIPNTGITLPFISYGGTSIIFLEAEMGMVLSVSNQIKLEK